MFIYSHIEADRYPTTIGRNQNNHYCELYSLVFQISLLLFIQGSRRITENYKPDKLFVYFIWTSFVF